MHISFILIWYIILKAFWHFSIFFLLKDLCIKICYPNNRINWEKGLSMIVMRVDLNNIPFFLLIYYIFYMFNSHLFSTQSIAIVFQVFILKLMLNKFSFYFIILCYYCCCCYTDVWPFLHLTYRCILLLYILHTCYSVFESQ